MEVEGARLDPAPIRSRGSFQNSMLKHCLYSYFLRHFLSAPLPAIIFLLMLPLSVAMADVTGYALVREDGSLQVEGRIIRLYGIYIPPTEVTCRAFIRPPRCAPRAALALSFKIQGFVHCEKVGVNKDGTISAICRNNYTSVSKGEDLAAYLLQQGWAVALPAAPFAIMHLRGLRGTRALGYGGFPIRTLKLK